jgi:hypothetical protein
MCVSAQETLDATGHHFLHCSDQRRMLHKHDADLLGKGQRPLAIARGRQNIVNQVRNDNCREFTGSMSNAC